MENKKGTNALLLIMGVLIVISLIVKICVISKYSISFVPIISSIPFVVSLIFIAVYGIWLYKKPHGNILKYAILLFSLGIITSAVLAIVMDIEYFEISNAINVDIVFKTIKILCAAALCYGAGRLDRINKNKILFPAITVILFAESISMLFTYPHGSLLMSISYFNSTIGCLTLMIAYFTRFKAHKEAGLADAPAKQ